MRQVVKFVVIVVIAIVFVLPGNLGGTAVAAAEPVTFSQVIRPLQCSVDIIAVGPRVNVRLVPAMCARSSEARQLLAATRDSLGIR